MDPNIKGGVRRRGKVEKRSQGTHSPFCAEERFKHVLKVRGVYNCARRGCGGILVRFSSFAGYYLDLLPSEAWVQGFRV